MEPAELREIATQRRLGTRDIIDVCRASSGRDGDPVKVELYRLTLDTDRGTAVNALRIFTHFDSHDLRWLDTWHQELIDRALAETDLRKLRMLLTLLFRLPFHPERLNTDFLDLCIRLFTDTSLPYAIRALGMKLAGKQMASFPELTGELAITLQLLEQEELSPGLLSAKRQVDEMIKKAQRRHRKAVATKHQA